MFFIRISPKMDSVVRGFEAAHNVLLLRVNDHPGPTGAKTGLDWAGTDYWPVQKCLVKLYSFLPSFLPSVLSGLIVIQCMRIWLFQSQPPTSSLVRDKYCLRSSTFHARLPPPVPWPAKSEGWNSCQMPSPASFEDDWKQVFVLSCFESISFKRAQKK